MYPPPPQHSSPYLNPGPPPTTTPSLGYSRPGYELHDDNEQEGIDTGDIPLLRRDPSQASGYDMPIPGGYDEDVNIRYGRIPQRIPRRYKTIKKVE